VNNNVSLLTVNIAPSTFLASLTLTLVFLSFYLPSLCMRIPRRFIPGTNTNSRTSRKPLPPVPDIDPNELLQDLPLVIDNRAALLLHDHLHEERHYHLEQRRRSSSKSYSSAAGTSTSTPTTPTKKNDAERPLRRLTARFRAAFVPTRSSPDGKRSSRHGEHDGQRLERRLQPARLEASRKRGQVVGLLAQS
ncbi:hypothetical protein MCOR08_011614, partial [Pyricularia oryzae]